MKSGAVAGLAESGNEQVKTPILRRAFVVNLLHGLHARPCALLVKTLQPFECRVEVKAGGEVANGQSIIGLMALAAGPGTKVSFSIAGKDAPSAMAAVVRLFESRFGEANTVAPAPAKAVAF